MPLHFGGGLLQSTADDDHYLPLVTNGLAHWEAATQAEWLRLSKAAAEIVDVGAYLGVYSVLAASVNPNASISAFEPNPKTYEALQANLLLNEFSNITALNFALGDEEKTVKLLSDTSRPMSSGASVSPLPEQGRTAIAVQQVRLDDYAEAPSLIKVDAEGMEIEVLRGASRILSHHSPDLVLEILTPSQFDRVIELLDGFGYQHPRFLGGSVTATSASKLFVSPGNYLFSGNPKSRFDNTSP